MSKRQVFGHPNFSKKKCGNFEKKDSSSFDKKEIIHSEISSTNKTKM